MERQRRRLRPILEQRRRLGKAVASLRLNGGLCYDTTHFTHFLLYLSRVYYY
jgi:hypothetical protein